MSIKNPTESELARTGPRRDPGSFRDPAGSVYHLDGSIYRTLDGPAAKRYERIRATGVLDRLIEQGWLVETETVSPSNLGSVGEQAALVLRHAAIPYVSYPYEWPFAALKEAALFHLELQLKLLDDDVNLVDATAYNVQFVGATPRFIDVLSLAPYQEGALWGAHKQFCEQFLSPLLLRALRGVPHNQWYRGSLEGISLDEIASLAPWRSRLDIRFLLHVLLPARAQARAREHHDKVSRIVGKGRLSRKAFASILRQLYRWVHDLEPAEKRQSEWAAYADRNTYDQAEMQAKRVIIARFSRRHRSPMLVDLGCNIGEFSEIAVANGTHYAVGFDNDHMALDRAFGRAKDRRLNILPLFQDVANPSPGQGWLEMERSSALGRVSFDAVFALAFVHHLAIGRNIPLDEVVTWLVALAPRGVVEFVPKADPTVQIMLGLREDVFPRYDQDHFERYLRRDARIIEAEKVSESGRMLYVYQV